MMAEPQESSVSNTRTDSSPIENEITWFWLYSPRGQRIERSVNGDVRAATANVQETVEKDFHAAIETIRRLDDFLQSPIPVSASTDRSRVCGSGLVTFDDLAAAGLIPASPTWGSVKEYLTESETDDHGNTDVEIREFSKQLCEYQSVWSVGLLLAAKLAHFSIGKSPVERLKHTLNAIRLRVDPGLIIRKTSRTDSLRFIQGALEAESVEQGASIRETIERIQYAFNAECAENNLNHDHIKIAQLNSWCNFINGSWPIPRDQRVTDSTAADLADILVCEVAGVGPATLIPANSETMSIGELSRLFVEGLVNLGNKAGVLDCPFIAALTALQRLGFSNTVIQRLKLEFASEHSKQLDEWQQLVSTVKRRSGKVPSDLTLDGSEGNRGVTSGQQKSPAEIRMILAKESIAPGGISKLPPDVRFPCLCLTSMDLNRIHSWLDRIRHVLTIGWLCLESPDTSPQEAIRPVVGLLKEKGRYPAAIYDSLPSKTQFEFLIPTPSKLSDLFDRTW